MSSLEKDIIPPSHKPFLPVSPVEQQPPQDLLGQARRSIISNGSSDISENLNLDRMGMLLDPYPFTEQDLSMEQLVPGVEITLEHFYRWRDTNPRVVESYLTNCLDQLTIVKSEYSKTAKIGRHVNPFARRNFKQMQTMRELKAFVVRNIAEVPDQEKLERFYQQVLPYEEAIKKAMNSNGDIFTVLTGQFSLAEGSPEFKVVVERLRRLYEILPERVIKGGAMGKVARTMLGVGAIAEYDMIDATAGQRKERFEQVAYGAVVYGASYAIIDDTLHDLKGGTFSQEDTNRYNETILKGLRTGKAIDPTGLPDCPLTDEVKTLYDLLRSHYPIEDYPQLYQAAESMYIAQYRDAQLTLEENLDYALTDIYPDIFIKSGMTRIVANILAGRTLDSGFYARCLNSMTVNQLSDDLVDYEEDHKAGRVTPFTYPYNRADTNPLYDIFAYKAYLANTVFPNQEEVLAYPQAVYFSTHFSRHPDHAVELLQHYGIDTPGELRQFLIAASSISEDTLKHMSPVDKKISSTVNKATVNRSQVEIDPQTFISDRIEGINNLIKEFVNQHGEEKSEHGLNKIMEYALKSGGKRLRPVLTLMLAESLGVEPSTIKPLLLASELFHTSSLLFDDLPWQDNSTLRRGKPTAHTVYSAASVELTGVSMLLEGIGILQELKNRYPAQDISDLTFYTTSSIQNICLGQNMDLHMSKTNNEDASLETVLRMYHLKTSVALEASLVPLMMLEKRPMEEIENIKQYAHHAGLVFQIKDDLLDAFGSTQELGKDAQQDGNKINIVQLCGIEKAREIMDFHLKNAINYSQRLPFNTNLLQGIVAYFSTRNR